jgi:hypothetical protein
MSIKGRKIGKNISRYLPVVDNKIEFTIFKKVLDIIFCYTDIITKFQIKRKGQIQYSVSDLLHN